MPSVDITASNKINDVNQKMGDRIDEMFNRQAQNIFPTYNDKSIIIDK